ncbi:MAG: low molecular weight protein arginine phosphatase [Clostridia bacterium]
MTRITYICTGNVCRSPMAQYYTQKLANNSKDPNEYYIESAGIYAVEGEKATENAINAMKKFDVNLQFHRATSLKNSLIEQADYIVVMTAMHKKLLKELYPKLKEKIFTLKQLAYGNLEYIDVDDPWGYNSDIYVKTAEEIIRCIDIFFSNLKEKENE